MNTTPPNPRRSDSDEIVLTDRDLVSRYIRYSENLEEAPSSPERVTAEELLSSSPASVASNHDGDSSHISALSNSTTQTTPFRNDLLVIVRRVPSSTPFEEFQAVLRDAELLSSIKDEYRQQGQNILQIAAHLFPQDRRVSQVASREQITDLIVATGDWFATAIHEPDAHIQNLDYIQTLGAFTISPGADEMWHIFKQMTQLVIAHTKPPSRAIVTVLKALASVYDAYVYQPALVDPRMRNSHKDLELQLHGLYDAIMSLLTKHQEWCRSTKELNEKRMKPALEVILSSPTVMQNMTDDEALRNAIDAVLDNPANPGYLPVTADVLKVLREKRSAQLLQIRAKRKYTRVHTV